MARQELLWVPEAVDFGGAVKKVAPIEYKGEKPWRVWTLYLHSDKASPPALPYHPRHNVNAFLEDYVHDWNIHDGKFLFGSRATSGGHWVLLEFKEVADEASQRRRG